MKLCSKCRQNKNENEFQKNITSFDGLRSACKACTNKTSIPKIGFKFCSKCLIEKSLEDFNIRRDRKSGRASACKLCSRTSTKPIPKEGHKYCTKCNLELPLSEYTKNQNSVYSICKTCVNKTSRRKAPEVKEYHKWCHTCSSEKPFSNFYIDKNKYLGLSSRCKSCCVSEVVKREKIRRTFDSSYKIKKLLRARLRHALKGKTKSKSTLSLLGCSIEFLKEHLQKLAIERYIDFDINNYSGQKYHIDHIIPCDSFNLKCSYHQKLCFNWSNLQILSAKENLEKSAKVQP